MRRKIVVTRHPALVQYMREQGLIHPGEDIPVISHITPQDKDKLYGAHVLGVIPAALALRAGVRVVTEIPLALTTEMRGKELTIEELRRVAGRPVTYSLYYETLCSWECESNAGGLCRRGSFNACEWERARRMGIVFVHQQPCRSVTTKCSKRSCSACGEAVWTEDPAEGRPCSCGGRPRLYLRLGGEQSYQPCCEESQNWLEEGREWKEKGGEE